MGLRGGKGCHGATDFTGDLTRNFMWQAPNQRIKAQANSKRREPGSRSHGVSHQTRVHLAHSSSPWRRAVKIDARALLNDFSPTGMGLFTAIISIRTMRSRHVREPEEDRDQRPHRLVPGLLRGRKSPQSPGLLIPRRRPVQVRDARRRSGREGYSATSCSTAPVHLLWRGLTA